MRLGQAAYRHEKMDPALLTQIANALRSAQQTLMQLPQLQEQSR